MDCSAAFSVPLNVTADACASAIATIRAAQIQADAARYAGDRSFRGGMLTLGAGVLAVLVSFVVARIQTNIERRHERAREHAFARSLELRLTRMKWELDQFVGAKDLGIDVTKNETLAELLPNVAKFIADFDPAAWESLVAAGDLVPLIDETYNKISWLTTYIDIYLYLSQGGRNLKGGKLEFEDCKTQVVDAAQDARGKIHQALFKLSKHTPYANLGPQGLWKHVRPFFVRMGYLSKLD